MRTLTYNIITPNKTCQLNPPLSKFKSFERRNLVTKFESKLMCLKLEAFKLMQ